MHLKNKTTLFFVMLIIILFGYILFERLKPPISVIIQAGHEGRTCGNTGTTYKTDKEVEWNMLVADEVAKQLKAWDIDVKRVPADIFLKRTKIAIAIHFDATKHICHSGASIGYPNTEASYHFAQRWKVLYKSYFPFNWNKDNFTDNLKYYYAYSPIHIDAQKFLVLELGELTCKKQTDWLKPRRKKIAKLIAYAIAVELGKIVEKPYL
ncbi:MAG: N-acetylmuramoyl-L-alanine amidase [Sulfurovum sp.]|nr:N-acetylmuramoyl-L-alanine amidase [Sulfurovum sp.]MCB4745866.1 N-acetylmuramoyl-L-alanine amidase [Sulfurovum sp.]MCB4748023.1 N-acetylmuramoyl-L-alanine amidase [Sulfurovum sp.]MCB4748933.1 N-acetylmuramoyl-L-alanine amidase [Sulfurovum sp.]MCB4751316.1 N-acetylmuramoyl-L-alanine amidase [Sulfurovum sp.]